MSTQYHGSIGRGSAATGFARARTAWARRGNAWRERLRRLACARWLLLAGVLLASGCRYAPHLSFLDAQGPIAEAERWHFYWVLGILAVLVAGPIFLSMPFVLWRYRYGNKKAKYTPKWKYSRLLEYVTWGGPVLIVCVLGWLVWQNAHRLDPYSPIPSDQPPLQVQVIGYDWKWLFIYPDQGIATLGTLAMPVGRPVAMHLTSATVMQSLFIPSLGSQIYAMGGMVTQLHLLASRPGRFLGENTMYSGKGFHKQKFTAVAMSPAEFKAWVDKVRTTGIPLDREVLNTISRRSSLSELIDKLAPQASHADAVYLTGVSPKLFPAVIRATQQGTRADLAAGLLPVPASTANKPPKPPRLEHKP